MPFSDPQKQREWQREYQRRRKAAKGREPNKTANNMRWRENNPEKHYCSRRVNSRVNRKHWPKPSAFQCSDCDDRAIHYHHEDYSMWWSVEPLCRACHGKRHQVIR